MESTKYFAMGARDLSMAEYRSIEISTETQPPPPLFTRSDGALPSKAVLYLQQDEKPLHLAKDYDSI
jgi:hypothetical protein